MNDNFSHPLTFRKPALVSKRGIVAAEAGAVILAQSGDCINAAIATSFALGPVEPWMSGIGGGGTMVVPRAGETLRGDRFRHVRAAGLEPGRLSAHWRRRGV